MHRYSRMHLSPDEAICNLDGIDLEEKSGIAEWIALVAVLEHRRDYLADRRPGVTTAAVLAPHLEPETVASSPEAATFQPEHEIVRLLAERSRATVASLLAAAGESLAGSTSCQHAAPHATSHLTHCNGVAGDVVAPGQRQAHAEHPRRGRVSPGAMGDYDVRLTITQAEHAELVRAQAALAELTRPLVVRGERMARCTA